MGHDQGQSCPFKGFVQSIVVSEYEENSSRNKKGSMLSAGNNAIIVEIALFFSSFEKKS